MPMRRWMLIAQASLLGAPAWVPEPYLTAGHVDPMRLLPSPPGNPASAAAETAEVATFV